MKKYYTTDQETGEEVEITKEEWDRIQAFKSAFPVINKDKLPVGKLIITGVMSSEDKDNFKKLFYNPEPIKDKGTRPYNIIFWEESGNFPHLTEEDRDKFNKTSYGKQILITMNDKRTSVERVKEFMITAGQPTPSIVPENEYGLRQNISPDRVKLRLSLCLEELSEIATEGFGEIGAEMFLDLLRDKIEEIKKDLINNKYFIALNPQALLDGLADLRVVTDGFAIEVGMVDIYEEAVDEVMDSNMSKFCKLEEDIKATVLKYSEMGIETSTEKVGDFYVIYRKEDMKVLKGVHYREPQLSKFFN